MKINKKFSFSDCQHHAYNTDCGNRFIWIPETGEFFVIMNVNVLFEQEPSTITREELHAIIDGLADATPTQKTMYHHLADERKSTATTGKEGK